MLNLCPSRAVVLPWRSESGVLILSLTPYLEPNFPMEAMAVWTAEVEVVAGPILAQNPEASPT